MVQTLHIKRRLKEAGLKGTAVAEKLGISSSALSLKLSGKRPWRPEELLSIVDALFDAGHPITLDEIFVREAA